LEKITINQALTSENFYRFPKIFMPFSEYDEQGQLVKVTSIYNNMSGDSQRLYMFLKNRIELSLLPMNIDKFTDKNGCIFVIATVEELETTLGCSHNKVIRLKKELIDYDLIEEVRQGFNKPNIIYVGNVQGDSIVKSQVEKNYGKEQQKSSERPMVDRNSQKRNSGIPVLGFPKRGIQEIPKGESSNTYLSYTKKIIDTKSTQENLSDFPLDFKKSFTPSFLTEQTVQLLSFFGYPAAQNYADIIFKQKKAVEFESKEMLGERIEIVGEYVSSEIEDVIQKFVFQQKTKEGKGEPMKRPQAYFTTMMRNFWVKSLYQQAQSYKRPDNKAGHNPIEGF
jgi:hypothetical protein